MDASGMPPAQQPKTAAVETGARAAKNVCEERK
jgi:hypothetical protein